MVVAATNQAENVVVNGMSFSARRARWANSALIVEVEPRDYPTQASGSALAGFAFQDQIERACFEAGGRDQTAPGQRVADFLSGRVSRDLPSSSYPLGLRSVDLAAVLPPFVCASLRAALGGFERTIPGFSGESGVMIAPETRTTSPIRFLRNEGLESVSLPGLYPVGEGAGYGGGIISSALDGLRAARVWVASRPCG
jgi:hypothetical protein